MTPRSTSPHRMTRRVLGVRALSLSGALAAAATSACAPTTTDTTPNTSTLTGKIRFYTRGGEVETRGQSDILIPTFKKVAPNVTVEHEIFTAADANDSYTLKLYALYAAGTPPDVFGFGQNYFGFWARGMLADLTPFINRDKFDLNQFHVGLPDKFKVKGKYYGIPQLTTFGTLLFYNKNLFDQAGIKVPTTDWDDKTWTFDVMLDYAKRLTQRSGEPDAIYGLNYSPGNPHGHAWLWGGDTFLPEHYTEGIAQRTTIDSPQSVEGHQFAQDIRWKHRVTPRAGTDPTTGVSFLNGRYAMDVNGGWNFWGYTVIKDFKWGVAAIPHSVTNKNPNYNDFWELSSESKSKEIGWQFIKHLSNPDVQREYVTLTGTPPTHKSAMDAWYKRFENSQLAMTRADIEKVTQGAINPKRSQENPDHTIIEWSKISALHTPNVNTPLNMNQGTARELLGKAKPLYDSATREIYEQFKGKTPN